MRILTRKNEKVLEQLLRVAGSSSLLEVALQNATRNNPSGVTVSQVIEQIKKLKSPLPPDTENESAA